MAYNRRMRKFESTCYIPGEQLAMMAKYYRGANLNLNLTLYEDDLTTMQETLNQACWCSKLDDVDRMKLKHMKGDAHDHCIKDAQGGMNPAPYLALPQRTKSAVSRVERGTSALSLHDCNRGLVMEGPYLKGHSDHQIQRHYYDQRIMIDYDDCQCRGASYVQNKNNSKCGCNDPRCVYHLRRKLRDSETQYIKGNYRDNKGAQQFYRTHPPERNFHRDDTEFYYPKTGHYDECPIKITPMSFNDRKNGMQSDATMSLQGEGPEIRCAVCNLETCIVCKNHLYQPNCQCKCPVANAGLCKGCRRLGQISKDDGKDEQPTESRTGSNKMDLSTMMMAMMMKSMLNNHSSRSICSCKSSGEDSETSSSDTSDGKVYLCDGRELKMNKIACECCKCGQRFKNTKMKFCNVNSHCLMKKGHCGCNRKDRQNLNFINNEKEASVNETSESDDERKGLSHKNSGNTKSSSEKLNKSGLFSNNHFNERKGKPMKNSPNKGTTPEGEHASHNEAAKNLQSHEKKDTRKKLQERISTKESSDFNRSGEMCSGTRSFNNPTTYMSTVSNINGVPLNHINCLNNFQFPDVQESDTSTRPDIERHCELKTQGDNGNTNFPLSSIVNISSRNFQAPSISDSRPVTQRTPIRRYQLTETVDRELDATGILSTQEDGDLGEELSSSINVRDFMVYLPKIQSHLQSLMSKLNQMDLLNDSIPYPQCGPPQPNTRPLTSHEIPLLVPSPGKTSKGDKLASNRTSECHSMGHCFDHLSVPKGGHNSGAKSNMFGFLEHPAKQVQPAVEVSPSEVGSCMQETECTSHHQIKQVPPIRFQIADIPSTATAQKQENNNFLSNNQKPSGASHLMDFVPFTDKKYEDSSRMKHAQQPHEQSNYINFKSAINDACGFMKRGDHNLLQRIVEVHPEKYYLHRPKLKLNNSVRFKAKQRGMPSLGNLLKMCSWKHPKIVPSKCIQDLIVENKGLTINEKVEVQDKSIGPGRFSGSIKIPSSSDEFRNGEWTVGLTPTRQNCKTVEIITKEKSETCSMKHDFPNRVTVPLSCREIDSQCFLSGCSSEQTCSSLEFRGSNKSSPPRGVKIENVDSFDSSQEINSMLAITPLIENERLKDSSQIEPESTDSLQRMLQNVKLLLSTYSGHRSEETPTVFRKSRVQVEQLKRAHETIRKMIQNVNAIIKRYDSDAKVSKVLPEDDHRVPSLLIVDDNKKWPSYCDSNDDAGELFNSHSLSADMTDLSNIQNPDVWRMFQSVNRVIDTVLTPSESNHCPRLLTQENSSSTQACKEYFVLDSDSSGYNFTETLRHSLESYASRSAPLPVETNWRPSQRQHQQQQQQKRERTTRPLKRRSWLRPRTQK